MADNDLKTASVLAFERKLDPSDALFSAGQWDGRADGVTWKAVEVREKSVRGTISNRLKSGEQDSAKLDASIQSPNLQKVDVASLPNNADTLRVHFTLRVLGDAGIPSACNNPTYQEKLKTIVKQYVEQQGFGELASRYAYNLANGRFLWRNRVGAEQVETQIRLWKKGQETQLWTFDALSFPLRRFDVPESAEQPLKGLTDVIQRGLTGNKSKSNPHELLDVVAYVRIGDGQEVYPSQELILDRGDKKGQKSKTLYTVGNVAGMHSQKIGNALRTIDTWYPDETDLGPIAIEPYGSVTSQGKACRKPKQKMDFYSLLDNWVLKDNMPEKEQQHYVIATLIRGGVFGDKEKE